MTGTVKRVVLWLFLAFVVYTVLASPDKAAELAKSAIDGIASGGHSLGQFFHALVS